MIISTPEEELVGAFKMARLDGKAVPVHDHDFRSQALGLAIPTASTICKPIAAQSLSAPPDTPQFAAESMARVAARRAALRRGHALLILADGAGATALDVAPGNGPCRNSWSIPINCP